MGMSEQAEVLETVAVVLADEKTVSEESWVWEREVGALHDDYGRGDRQ